MFLETFLTQCACRFFEKLCKICIIKNKNVFFHINKHEIASYLYVKNYKSLK